ncbi:MAG: MBL fold metallo-hydrolase [Spirochaetales bacterium]|nr:MBL fold metallo-hydrolase [Spirochaetales bacterium]
MGPLTYCYLIKTRNGYIMADTGFPGKADILWNFLEEREIAPESIKLIIITHGHFDHTGSLSEIKEKTGASILINQSEGLLLKKGISPPVILTNKWIRKLSRLDKDLVVPQVIPDIMVDGNFTLTDYGLDARVIHTPGHTAGSLSVIIEGRDAIVGDLAMNFGLLSRFSYIPIIAVNMKEVYQSWRKIIDMGVQTIYPAHGKVISIDVLKNSLSKLKKTFP